MVEKIKSRVAQLMDIDVSEIKKVIEIGGDAVIYLNDNTKYAFSDDKLVKIEKPEAKPEKVISDDTERDFSDDSFEEEEEEKSMDDLEAELLAEVNEMSEEIFEEVEEVDWDDVEAALEALNKKDKLLAAKKARRRVENARLQREREEAEANAKYVDPTYNPDTGNTIAEDVNKEKQSEINARLEAERQAESQRKFDEAMQAEKDRIEAEKAAYADDIEKYGYKVGRIDDPTQIDMGGTPVPTIPVEEAEISKGGQVKPATAIGQDDTVVVTPIVPEVDSTEHKPFETTHQKVVEPESGSPATPILGGETVTPEKVIVEQPVHNEPHVIVPPIVDTHVAENVVTPATVQETGARVTETTNIPTAVEEPTIAPTPVGQKNVIDEPVVAPIIETPIEAAPVTPKIEVHEQHVVETQFEQPKVVPVVETTHGTTHGNTKPETIPSKTEDIVPPVIEVPTVAATHKEQQNVGIGQEVKREEPVVIPPVSGAKAPEQPIGGQASVGTPIVEAEPIVSATPTHKVVEAATGAAVVGGIVDNTQHSVVEPIHQNVGGTEIVKPITDTQIPQSVPVVETPQGAVTVETPKVQVEVGTTPIIEPHKAEAVKTVGAEFKPMEGIQEQSYRPQIIPNNEHRAVEVNVPPVNVINATFDGTHYVADNGKKFTKEEVLVTATGVIVDNTSKQFKLDDNGAVTFEAPVISQPVYQPEAPKVSILNATFDGNNYVSSDGRKYAKEEVIVTPSGAVIDNTAKQLKLDDKGNVTFDMPVITTPTPVVTQVPPMQVLNATLNGDHYVTNDGQKFAKNDVIVTATGVVIDNTQKHFRLDNNGEIAFNTPVASQPIYTETPKVNIINATFDGSHYVAPDGKKFTKEEVLVTTTGAIIDNTHKQLRLDNEGNVTFASPVPSMAYVPQVETPKVTVLSATFDGTQYIADSGKKFDKADVIVTSTGAIIDNTDKHFKLDDKGNIVLATPIVGVPYMPVQEVKTPTINVFEATFNGTHYVSSDGRKYAKEEVIVTPSGAVIDNTAKQLKLDEKGNITFDMPTAHQPVYAETPKVNIINATFDGSHYVAPDGKKFTKEEVLITTTGVIVENTAKQFKLDNNGNIVPVVTTYAPIQATVQTPSVNILNATFDGTHYINSDGRKFEKADVLVTATGAIIDNTTKQFRLDDSGNVVATSVIGRTYIPEVKVQNYNVLEATFNGTHYVATDGKKFTREEVLVTATGVVIDNRDNKLALNDKGDVIYKTPVSAEHKPIGSYDTLGATFDTKGSVGGVVEKAPTFNVLDATFNGTHYVSADGRKFEQKDVLITSTGVIIDNTSKQFKLDDKGNIGYVKADIKVKNDEAAFYAINGIPYIITEKAVRDNLTFTASATAVLTTLNANYATLKGEVSVARKELEALRKTEGNADKIKSLEETIKTKTDKLIEIKANQNRVNDFIQNGAKEEFILTRDKLDGKAKYSKEHTQELKKAMQEGKKSPIDDGLGKKKVKTGDSADTMKAKGSISTEKGKNKNMETIHGNRMQQVFSKYGKKFGIGAGRTFKRVMRENEDLDKEVEMYDETILAKDLVYNNMASKLLNAELIRLGLDKGALAKELSKIGSVAGIGDVSKLSLEELQAIMNSSKIKLSMDAKKDLIKAINIKKKLALNNTDLASEALKGAGEYLNYSKKRLQKMLSTTTDAKIKAQIELALKYKNLDKFQRASLNKWQSIKAVASEVVRKLLGNDETMSSILGLGDNAMMTYRATKAVVKLTQKAMGKTASTTGQKLVKESLGFTRKAANTNKVATAGKNVIQTAGKKGVQTAATGTAKGKAGQMLASGVAKVKGAFGIGGAASAGAGATAGGAGAGGAAGVAGGAAGGAGGVAVGVVAAIVILIILGLIIVGCLVGSIFSFVMGDETSGTSVPQLVEYLEEKNTNLLTEIENRVSQTPTRKDKQGNTIDEYTKVHYTFYDDNGNICVVTDNTKELICMAAVYFEQDFTDEDAIKDWLDKMWDKTHKVTYSESALYGCEGEVCLNPDGTFASSATGFNGGERKFQCTEDYNAITYNNCFILPTENTIRVEMHKLSYRFADTYLNGLQFNGISPIYVKSSLKGYGCKTKTATYSCYNIKSIYNTEVLVRLVEATATPYSTLLSQEACYVGGSVHANSYNKPATNCVGPTQKYQTNRMSTSYNLGDDLTFTWNSTQKAYMNEMGLSFKGFSPHVQSNGKEPNLDKITLTYDGTTGSGYNKQYKYYYRTYTYICNEVVKSCPGHSITYHYCDGQHKEKVCYGHVDLTVNISVLSFDEIFDVYVDDSRDDFEWTEDYQQWVKMLYDQDWEEVYDVYVSVSLFNDTIIPAIMPTHPNSLPIPLYDQTDYPNSPYGAHGSIASHGCGITCVAMLEAYYKDKEANLPHLARVFGHYNTSAGSLWILFEETASELQIPFEKQTSSWSEVIKALQDGKPVVSIQNQNGIFTSGGHFILLTGITADGKILVNDPNGANYNKASLKDGFANGFTQSQIQVGSSGAYWIYGVKPE